MSEEWMQQFADLCQKTHTEQAVWWLNGFWHDGGEEAAEDIWNFCNRFIEIETDKKILYGKKNFKLDEKCDLDEHQSHRFLEQIGETLTVRELRQKLKKLDIDSNNRLSISEYLLSKYTKSPQDLVDSPQGGVDPEVLAEAQSKCDAAQESLNVATEAAADAKTAKLSAEAAARAAASALAESEREAAEAKVALELSNKKAEEAETALKLSNQRHDESKEATAKQEAAEAEIAEAEAESKAAADALEAEEKAHNGAIEKLEVKINSGNLSTVKRGSCVQQLAQLRDKDPLPLRKAKLTQKAVLKKLKKARKKAAKATKACKTAEEQAKNAADASNLAKQAADEAAAAAAEAKQEADDAAVKSAEAKAEADETHQASVEAEEKAMEAQEAATQAFSEAREYLTELKNSDAPPNGRLWWMDRIMQEKEKFLPRRKRKKNKD